MNSVHISTHTFWIILIICQNNDLVLNSHGYHRQGVTAVSGVRFDETSNCHRTLDCCEWIVDVEHGQRQSKVK